MELFYYCDRVISDDVNPNLPIEEIKELNSQMQCNFEFSEENETYFNSEELPNHVTIVDELEMFMRDAECEVWK